MKALAADRPVTQPSTLVLSMETVDLIAPPDADREMPANEVDVNPGATFLMDVSDTKSWLVPVGSNDIP